MESSDGNPFHHLDDADATSLNDLEAKLEVVITNQEDMQRELGYIKVMLGIVIGTLIGLAFKYEWITF